MSTILETTKNLANKIDLIKSSLRIKGVINNVTTFEKLPEMIDKATVVKTSEAPSFQNSASLKSIAFSSDVSEIPQNAFKGCQNLEKVVIPTSIKHIGEDAFKDCPNLTIDKIETPYVKVAPTWIAVDNKLENIGLYGANDVYDINIPEGVTEIDEYCFYDCRNLQSIVIPWSVSKLGDLCFLNCKSLSEITFNGMTAAEVSKIVADTGIGLEYDELTNQINYHTVICWCITQKENSDGETAEFVEVVIVNDITDCGSDGDVFDSQEKKTYNFDVLIKNLENFGTAMKKGQLPTVGSLIPVKFSDYVTPFVVLGYNDSIPRYVKYMNEGDRVWMDVIKDGLLRDEFIGADVYLTKDGDQYIGTVTAVSNKMFIYGNNCPYQVPMSITVNGTSYTFAGYNITLQSKYALNWGYNYSGNGVNSPYTMYFNTSYNNRYSNSSIRENLNSGIIYQKLDPKIVNNAIDVVNRTWVHTDWITDMDMLDQNDCEHVVDKIWLLGAGHVNDCNPDFPDYKFDTTIFKDIYTERTTSWNSSEVRRKQCLNNDGSVMDYESQYFWSSACYWWLRSANTNYNDYVANVDSHGYVDYYNVYNSNGVAPACTIG